MLRIDSGCKNFKIKSLGNFKLQKSDSSWNKLLMLGAIDYYSTDDVESYQIVPLDVEKQTIDIPDMSIPWSDQDLCWRYACDLVEWPYHIPEGSIAITNLSALYGGRLTEFFRFEDDEWEIFSGNGALEPVEAIRMVPVSVLIKCDPGISNFINDPVGKGKFRDSSNVDDDQWYEW